MLTIQMGFILALMKISTICIWDCKAFDAPPTGYQSFVFQIKNLDSTVELSLIHIFPEKVSIQKKVEDFEKEVKEKFIDEPANMKSVSYTHLDVYKRQI